MDILTVAALVTQCCFLAVAAADAIFGKEALEIGGLMKG